MLEASIAAGYEAPLRFYLTENADGTATLSYKTASFVFAPYADGGEELKLLAAELEDIQSAIAAATAAPDPVGRSGSPAIARFRPTRRSAPCCR